MEMVDIKVVEKSVWGDKIDEMYSKLPTRAGALKLSDVVKKWN